MRLGRTCTDPEHVKSPHPPTSSKAGSFKASFGSKSGFLSLLLCCTAGAAGSLVDDKSSILRHQRRPSLQHGKQPPPINTDPVLLNEHEPPVTSNTPLSSPNVSAVHACIRWMDDLKQQQQDEEGHVVRLLPPMDIEQEGRKCLVLDLDETLVHSSFKVFWHC